jgi:hypothetical protein
MSAEQSDDSFWEEHKLALSMTVGSLFAAAGALAMHRLSKQHDNLESTEVNVDQDLGDTPQTDA